MAGPSEYDKLKEMYRLQGQDEQAKRFRATTGMPEAQGSPAAPGPMEGLEPSPIMEASISEDRAKRDAADARYDSASRAFGTAKFGPEGQQGYGDISPDSFLGKYDIYPYEGEFRILKTLEDRGHVTLSPELKRDIAKVQRTGAAAEKAGADLTQLAASQKVGIYRPTNDGKYVRADSYDPYKR